MPKQRIKETYLVMQDSDYQLFTESVESELLLEYEQDPAAVVKRTGFYKIWDWMSSESDTLPRSLAVKSSGFPLL